MNWILLGKICVVLIAVLQGVIKLCNGQGFDMATISTIIAALVAAGFIHGGQVQMKNQAIRGEPAIKVTKAIKSILLIACLLPILTLTSCAESAIIAGATGGAASAGGIAYWLLNQPWMAKICYWVGDEGALTTMPVANATVDADTIAVCAEGIAYLQTAEGIPATTINAQLAASLAKLPSAQVKGIQEAAQFLDEFLPPSTSTLVLTKDELNDIIGFLEGWEDGTRTCLDNLPASRKELLKAKSKIASIRSHHPQGVKAAQPGGWFVLPDARVTLPIRGVDKR